MKKYAIFMLLIAIVIGCNKKTSNPSTPSSSSPPPSPMSNVSAAEAIIVGHWIYDSVVYYNSNVTYSVQPASASNASDFTYDASSTPYSGGSSNWKEISYQRTSLATSSGYWYVTDLYLSASGKLKIIGSAPLFGGYIINITSNSLVLSASYASVKQGNYYYFHK